VDGRDAVDDDLAHCSSRIADSRKSIPPAGI
jgi:hypothetical protein